MRRFISLVILVFCFGTQLSAGRVGDRRTEYLPGSARLSLKSIQYIVLPTAANDRLVSAAEDLQHLFVLRYGVTPEILTDGTRRPKLAIYLSASSVRSHGLEMGGFFIYREGTRLIVSADSTDGLVNGVYAISSDVLGARWYWPGAFGLELVGAPQAKFPERRWREEPSYVMRTLYPVDGEFGRRNRLVGGFKFNHALAKVFTPAVYAAEPEIFSMVNGRRREPRGHGGRDPQPDFTRDRTVELAAEAALAHFTQKPESQSFSLSINDNVLFDQSEATRVAVEPLQYFRRRPNYTDLVFGFMNQVAAKVFDAGGAWTTPSGQPRYLTALAYYWTEQSPSFRLHPRVMPVLTSDRAQWHDPRYRAEDKALIERWTASGAERIATWDYYFGAPYPYPRQFNEWIVESLAFMSEAGVSVFFSQMPSAWGLDGGKTWLTARLLWDASADADALLNEYYTNFFGAAASPIRKFYELAEAHRNAHEGTADWIKFYKDEAGIELFGEDALRELSECIEQAELAVATDPRRAQRVTVVAEAFAFTQAYARYQQARTGLVECSLNVLSGDAAEVDQLQTMRDDFLKARSASKALLADLVKDPIHGRLSAFSQVNQSQPLPLALAAMAHGGSVLPLGADAALAGIVQRWGVGDGAFRSMLSNVDLRHGDAAAERNFLGPALPDVPGWYFDFRPSEHLAVESAVGSSAKGLRVTGADVFSIFRDIPVISEQDYLLDALLAYRISPDNRTNVKLIWSDRDGRRLRSDVPVRFPTGESAAVRRIALPLRAPAHAYTLRVHFIVSRQYQGDYLELQKVDLGLIVQ